MDSFIFQDRVHIPISTLNGMILDFEEADSLALLDTLPVGMTVLNGFQVSSTSPNSFGVNIAAGIARNAFGKRIINPLLQQIFATPSQFVEELYSFATPVTTTPETAPVSFSYGPDNSEVIGTATPTANTSLYRIDVIWISPVQIPDDFVTLDFLQLTGSITQQSLNGRLLDYFQAGVSIGEQVANSNFSQLPIPSIPNDAVPLAYIQLAPGAITISQSNIVDARPLYNILAQKVYITLIPSGESSYLITHNLNSKNIVVNVRQGDDLATPTALFPSAISFLNLNQLQISFSSALPTDAVVYLLNVDKTIS